MAEELYVVYGKVYKYVVKQPAGSSKYYVHKESRAGKRIGASVVLPTLDTAKNTADRRAAAEGFV